MFRKLRNVYFYEIYTSIYLHINGYLNETWPNPLHSMDISVLIERNKAVCKIKVDIIEGK